MSNLSSPFPSCHHGDTRCDGTELDPEWLLVFCMTGPIRDLWSFACGCFVTGFTHHSIHRYDSETDRAHSRSLGRQIPLKKKHLDLLRIGVCFHVSYAIRLVRVQSVLNVIWYCNIDCLIDFMPPGNLNSFISSKSLTVRAWNNFLYTTLKWFGPKSKILESANRTEHRMLSHLDRRIIDTSTDRHVLHVRWVFIFSLFI